MYKIVDVGLQGSDQWHAWRKGKIGASMVASILGLNPFETALQLYNRILNDESIPDNSQMAKGRELEPIARDAYNVKWGTNYQPACAERIDYPWMIASLDGWAESREVPVLEIKCGGKKLYDMALLSEIPEYYKCQLAWQMWVTGAAQVCYLVWFEGEYQYSIVFRDEAFIAKMVTDVKLFYNRLINFDPPEPTDKDYVQIEDVRSLSISSDYERVCQEIDHLQEVKELFREKLIDCSGNRNAKIGALRLTKVTTKGRVQYQSIPALKDVNLDEFRGKNIESWRIS